MRTRNNVELFEIILCPVCKKGSVGLKAEILSCESCKVQFQVYKDTPALIDKKFSQFIFQNLTENAAWEDYDPSRITKKVARFSTNKKSIYQKITPSYRVQIGPNYKEFLEKYNISGKVLELGGGPNSMNVDGVVNCDINAYSTVDIIGDARNLPFQDNTFDAIICNSVLEHIFEVDQVASECKRILKDKGYLFMCVPQICGRHHTVDFFRWTLPGLKKQFSQFEIIDDGIILGPGMFINHLIVSMFISITPFTLLNKSITFVLEWLFFPLRFLDYLGRNKPEYRDYAHTIYIIAQPK